MSSRNPAETKHCPGCDDDRPLGDFSFQAARPGRSDTRRTYCRVCEARKVKARRERARQAAKPEISLDKFPSVAAFDKTDPRRAYSQSLAEEKRQERERARLERATKAAEEAKFRRESEFERFDPGDWDTSVSNDTSVLGRATSGQASREKRQEFNQKMGAFASDLRTAATDAHKHDGDVIIPADHASYITALEEQEHRFGNRRWARSIAIAEAHEHMSRKAMMMVANRYFANKIESAGYAQSARPAVTKRTACLLLSDLHLGSELDSLDEPVTFKAIEEARRLEFILRQFIDYKPQYRDHSEALVIINGDIIEGQLMHDFRAGAPLAEQKAIFWMYFREIIGQIAAHFPSVRVVCQPGNHGRDKVRHPGRATARKWDGHEWECYYALKMMCSGLLNVTWDIPFRAVSIVDLHGSVLGITHADTEVKLGDPDTKSTDNARVLDRINATRMYGVEFDAWAFGHYHKPRYQPRNPRIIWNGALVPPNGHARSNAYIGEPCGQYIWEAVEGFPVGDLRFVEVGQSQDYDESLGKMIKPFRFTDLH